MSLAPFPIDSALTAIALAYRNDRLIADEVLPRVPVAKQEFRYIEHTLAESFTVPETKVGRKSRPNEVDFSAVEKTAATEDYGLEDAIPQRDIDNAPDNYDPKGRAIAGLADLIALDREVRTAGIVFDSTLYPSSNTVTLSGTAQWTDPTSDPVDVILEALDSTLVRPSVMVLGHAVFRHLMVHPKIIVATKGPLATGGIALKDEIAKVFGLDKVLVGESWVNTARRGQPVSLGRVWGNHCALLHINPMASTGNGVTFGLTAEFGSRRASQEPDRAIGLDGGVRVRAGESVKELIIAPNLGFLIKNAV
jgi:hypothetical protein